MEMANASEQTAIIGELTQGRELVNQLKNQLDHATSSEKCEELIQSIVSTYDKALSMLNWRALKRERSPAPAAIFDSSYSPVANSPTSDCSDHVSKDHISVFKKRKTLQRWSKQVRVCSGTGLEGPLNDGHSWRKYGQKDILGAKFPRSYYRCTHRNTQGCLATKQVQRSEEDPSIFEVTYRGRHSCIQASNSASTVESVEKEITKPSKAQSHEIKDSQIQAQPALEMLPNPGQGLKVETESLNTSEENFPSFSFPLAPIECENVESQFFSDPMKETDLIDTYSPGFLSPTASESNYFSSECQINIFGIGSFLKSSEYHQISTPTSVTESPFGDWDFSIDQVNFDPTSSLDNLAYFS